MAKSKKENKVLVKGLHSTNVEPLTTLLFNSFEYNWSQNDTFQLDFVAYLDNSLNSKKLDEEQKSNSLAYAMLSEESSIFFDGQEFIVKQCSADSNGQVETKTVSATHVYNEVGRIRQRSVKTGTLTYSVNDVLSFYLNGNTYGFTYKVFGEFEKQQITDLGNSSGKDMLSKIQETWPTCVIYPDNREIQVYSADAWATDLGGRIDYIHDSNDIKLSTDSTEIVNQLMVYGAEKDSEGDNVQYYFPPHIVKNQDSIDKWGVHEGDDLSDDRFTNASAMDAYALTQMKPEPTLTIEVTSNKNEKPKAGEVRRLEIRTKNFVTNVSICAFTWYPLDETQVTSITLNNTAKTILDYQSNSKENLTKIINKQKQLNNGLRSVNNQLNYSWTGDDVNGYYN